MFYKFVGGEDAILLDVFDRAVVEGSVKFGAATAFNDPFEFKFRSVVPSREVFDSWHEQFEQNRSPQERQNAWDSFSGEAKDWNSQIQPRIDLLDRLFILCLTKRWDSHLMWAHYAGMHRGFAVCYKSDLVLSLEDIDGCGPVRYRNAIPELRWFAVPPNKMLEPILFSKSQEWSYEEEYRVIMPGPPSSQAIFQTVNPGLVSGVILGSQAPEALIQKALALREKRYDFSVEQAHSKPSSYNLVARTMDDSTRALKVPL